MGGSSSSKNVQKSTNFNNMGEARGKLAGNLNQGENASLDIQNLKMTDSGAVREAGKVAGKAVEENSDTAQAGLDLAGFLGEKGLEDVEDARDSAEMMFKVSQGSMKDINRRTLQQMQQSNDRALAEVAKSTRSDTTQLSQQIIQYGGFAVGGLALAIFLANRG